MPKPFYSRREFLIGMGAAGAGTAFCACGGAALLAVSALRDRSTPTPPTITAPQQPTIPAVPPPEMVSRQEWGALPPDHTALNEFGFYPDNPVGWRIYDGELQDAYQTVVIHHSAFYEEDDLSTLLEIQRLHREDRKWADVAYHYFVGASGILYEGRDRSVRGTHVEGYNSGSLGICLLGDFRQVMPTDSQLAAAQRLIRWAADRLQLTHLAAHRDFNPMTECPGTRLYEMIAVFAQAVGLQTGIGGYQGPPQASAACPCCARVT